MANRPVDLDEKLSLFSERWAPKVIARLNDYEIKVVKLQGEFVWHTTTTPTSCSWCWTASSESSCGTAM